MKTVRFAAGSMLAVLLGLGSAQTEAAELPSTAPEAVFSTNRFYPVPLENFYKRLFSSYRPTESWGLVPRGLQLFDKVPFRMFGQLEITGLGPARDKNFHPARVGPISIGRRAARIHLIHGAGYDAPDLTPIAAVRLNYANGEMRKLFIRYGVHVRNWYAEVWEKRATLQDSHSLVIWNGNTRANGTGTPTRLFKTTFDNPFPNEQIENLDLLSMFARANSVILAITIETPEAEGLNPLPNAGQDEDDSEFRRETLLRIIDSDTGAALSNVVVEVAVSESGRNYPFGTYKSNKHGQILFDYPPAKFEELKFKVTNSPNPPALISLTNDEGIYGAEIPLRVKRSPAAPPAN
jgi:hypothetical protein